ncbi:MAG: PadR family transcriptional regulator [Candidatus Hodarchaeota archaeon]
MTDQTSDDLCCPPDCCDMRGFLTFQILWELRNESLTGQEIAERIAKRRGTKPTPGTIYPALKELKEQGSIQDTKDEEDKRKVYYSLTDEGKKGLNDAARYFHQVFGDIADECKVIVTKIGDCSKC